MILRVEMYECARLSDGEICKGRPNSHVYSCEYDPYAKLRLRRTDTPKSRAFWAHVEHQSFVVSMWPRWKRGW